MILGVLWNFLDWTWLVTGLVAILTFVQVRHLLAVRSLPPGPFSVPLLGNLQLLSFQATSLNTLTKQWYKKYGDIYTIWLGPNPTIVVSGWDLCKEGLVSKKNDFSGRIIRHSSNVYLDNTADVIFADYGPAWEALKRILVLAVRKYSVSDKLATLAAEVVDEISEMMVKEEKPFDPENYIYLALYNVLASSVFGHRYSLEDPEFLGIRSCNDKINEVFEEGLPSDALPFLRFVFRGKEKRLKEASNQFRSFFWKHYEEHLKSYNKGTVRDFTDAVIASRDEAKEESKESAQYLTDGNIVSLMIDLFSAGTETTRLTIGWLLLYICNEPELQRKMQKEIDDNIGSRPPLHSDRDLCPFVYASITEILRVRPILDFSLEHKSICNTELGGYTIPEGVSVLFNIKSCHQDESLWPESAVFKPERFLDENGSYNRTKLPGYMPFSLGRRACPGEKLGMIDVFLIVVRLLQNCSFKLDGSPGSANTDPKVVAFVNNAHPYKVIATKRTKD